MSIASVLSPAFARLTEIAHDRARMRFLRNSLIGTALAFLVGISGVTAFSQHYRIGVDIDPVRCLPENIYWIKLGKPAHLARGDYIAFVPPHGLMLPRFDGRMLAKQIAGLPGDQIVVKNDRAYVNGRFIGALILNGKLGKGAGGFDRVETVPAGKLFVVGTLPRSYDSRYWGFLNQHDLVGTVTPIY
ncbi:signal peptidase I [Burkholderia gladioli]|uniref:signal peptidase I n=1 Tax=Burkholderia gladioli TaxID=28095 RepID=UPI001FC8B427|nr:signal peptidase I [Burkholderia gladioli]